MDFADRFCVAPYPSNPRYPWSFPIWMAGLFVSVRGAQAPRQSIVGRAPARERIRSSTCRDWLIGGGKRHACLPRITTRELRVTAFHYVDRRVCRHRQGVDHTTRPGDYDRSRFGRPDAEVKWLTTLRRVITSPASRILAVAESVSGGNRHASPNPTAV